MIKIKSYRKKVNAVILNNKYDVLVEDKWKDDSEDKLKYYLKKSIETEISIAKEVLHISFNYLQNKKFKKYKINKENKVIL